MNYLYKALIYDKQASLSVLDTTELVNKAIKIHSLKGGEAELLGGLLTVCAYFSGTLKSDRGAVSMTVKSASGDGSASVSGDKDMHIRGFAEGSCRQSLRGGTLTVIRDDGFFRPFTGACQIESDDVSAMTMDYFYRSEQIPTAVSVGVKLGDDGSCLAAGGVIIQLLPGHTEETMNRAEERMQAFADPASIVQSVGAEGIVRTYFSELIDQKGLYLLHPDYICNCSRAKIADVILSLGRREALDICRERGCVSVHCHYCNTDYTFDEDDILKLFDR